MSSWGTDRSVYVVVARNINCLRGHIIVLPKFLYIYDGSRNTCCSSCELQSCEDIRVLFQDGHRVPCRDHILVLLKFIYIIHI